jgi:hypothetical protein
MGTHDLLKVPTAENFLENSVKQKFADFIFPALDG